MDEIDAEDIDDDGEDIDYGWTFVGTCTCQHDKYQHGFGWCDFDGCKCQAGWEE